MKTIIRIGLAVIFFLVAKNVDADIGETNSFAGVLFSISTTNKTVLPGVTNIFFCRIANTSTNLMYFYPSMPEYTTQIFTVGEDGKGVRLTKDLSTEPGGGPCFTLSPKAVKEYNFYMPISLVDMQGKSSVYAEVSVYFDSSKDDMAVNGIVTHRIKSNTLGL